MPESPLRFSDYPPPPGGMRRLQHALAQSDNASTRRAPRTRFLAATALAVAAWAVCVLPGWRAQQQRESALTTALQQALSPLEEPIKVKDGIAVALPSGQSNVRLYLLQSLTPPSSGQNTIR